MLFFALILAFFGGPEFLVLRAVRGKSLSGHKKRRAGSSSFFMVQRLITNPNRKVFIGYGYFVVRVKIGN